MIAHLVMSTGMTWDEVQDQLDIPALSAFTRYWESHPPIHVMVAGYLGIEPKKGSSGPVKTNDDATIAELMTAFPGAGS